MPPLAEKASAFLALHHQASAFIIPNPWDIGSAQILAALGFKALATTSAGFAFSIGKRDNRVSREATLAHLRDLAGATPLPVSADLGPCFGDDPGTVGETITLAGATGIVGGSVEDATGDPARPIYEKTLAVERVEAAVAAARRLPFPFALTARCENYLNGRRDLADTIDRLQRYGEAGADVLFAPGLTSKDDIAAVVRAVGKPVNVLAGMTGLTLTAAELSQLGVKRISVGSGLARASLGVLVRAAEEMRDKGTFTFTGEALNSKDANGFFAP
jgi:2-methylisocitrate lyase-like PEP mutase family enzyme